MKGCMKTPTTVGLNDAFMFFKAFNGVFMKHFNKQGNNVDWDT